LGKLFGNVWEKLNLEIKREESPLAFEEERVGTY